MRWTRAAHPGGRDAEAIALRYLSKQGLELEVANFNCRFGEIDLVMSDRDQTLVMIEVRHRNSAGHGGAAASIDYRKRHKLTRAAEVLLRTHPEWACRRCRFDVLALDGPLNSAKISWIKAAFEAA